MDFEISDKMKTITGMMREFLEKEIIPIEPEFLRKSFKEMKPVLEEKRAMVKKMELWAPNHPKEYGGMGLDLMEHALVSEALGRSPLGLYMFGCQAPDAGNIEILHKYGTPEQKEKYLRPLVEGKIRSCFSMTEVDMPGSNPVMLETTAVKDGKDYVINGQKWYTSSADGSEFAIVMAVTNPGGGPVPQGKHDHRAHRHARLQPGAEHPGDGACRGRLLQPRRDPLPELPRAAGRTCSGPEGHGFVIAQERLGPGRIHHCMRWIGICNRAFDLMCSRAAKRIIAPDGKTLATRQIVQSWIAESAAEIQAARLMTLHAAWKIEKYGVQGGPRRHLPHQVRGGQHHAEGGGPGAAGARRAGHDRRHHHSRIVYRHERAARIYDGADEVHKMSVAKRILKGYETKTVS